MEFSIKSGATAPAYRGAIVVGVYESLKLTEAGVTLDRATQGYLSALLKRGDFDGKAGVTLLLPRVPQLNARVLLVGLGKVADLNDDAFRKAAQAALRTLDNAGFEDATVYLPELKQRDIAWQITQATLIAGDIGYRFTQMKSKPETKRRLKRVTFNVERAQVARATAALKRASAIVNGMTLTKDLGNLPGNICTPTYLANQARALAKSHKLKVQVLDKRALEKLGAGALLSVARGSIEPPYLIALEYQGAARTQKPIALVGKGITFDTGGISIKPSAEMDEMKYDMCGAASVLGTIKAIAEMKLPINVVGIIPTTENMPSGSATKPGDVVTSLSGQTIEILNTDAEGRLILCDALTYAERFQPQAVIDIATLTGACVIALGHVASGLLANDDALAQKLLEAGQTAHDRAWQLPLWDDYQPQLASNFADFANIGGRAGGTITAACFLARFTKKYKWAHLDIAGTAWKSGKDKGATGRPVPLLAQFLIERAGK